MASSEGLPASIQNSPAVADVITPEEELGLLDEHPDSLFTPPP
ncbi:hypothetical protein [Streptomyces daqingensis]|nr:hypothetical protein [Streptomyces daqingensis]